MTDAGNDAHERVARKDLPIGEQMRIAKTNYFDALRNCLYCPKRSVTRRRKAEIVVRKRARDWDRLVSGKRAKDVTPLLRKLGRKDEHSWAELLCEVADMPNIFDELARYSPFAKQGGISVVTVNGDLIFVRQGVLRDKIVEQLPRNVSLQSHHVFVVNQSTLLERVGP